jgi:hypothetical protein
MLSCRINDIVLSPVGFHSRLYVWPITQMEPAEGNVNGVPRAKAMKNRKRARADANNRIFGER